MHGLAGDRDKDHEIEYVQLRISHAFFAHVSSLSCIESHRVEVI